MVCFIGFILGWDLIEDEDFQHTFKCRGLTDDEE